MFLGPPVGWDGSDLDSGPVNGDSSDSAALEIAFCLIYAYRHNPIIQARKMANPEHLAVLAQGVEAWNEWCQENPDFRANLSEANLSGATLFRANLHGADFSESWLNNTVFATFNLAEAKNLGACHHEWSSILDFHTFQQSGPLPLTFTRDCGLPDVLIDYLPSLLNQPIQFYSCFISYSSKDEDFAQRLYADLQNKGARCWFAPEDIHGGHKIYEQLGEAIRLHEKLLLVLSEHSMSSKWVRVEIDKARQREEREKRQVLFPIRLVDYETIEQWECFSAHEIREYFIPDFSNWKSHDAYQQAFDRLLRDLKPELERKPEMA